MPADRDFEQMWRDLAPVGRSAASGGYFRSPLASAERECGRGSSSSAPPAGSTSRRTAGQRGGLVGTDRRRTPGVLIGSHLDSVLDGGAFDGPLGVVSALAAIDPCASAASRRRGRSGSAMFVEEEGSRFGLACLGSRLATGATTWEDARELRDRDGVFLADAMAAAGLDPSPAAAWTSTGSGPSSSSTSSRVATSSTASVAVGLASEIWAHGRWRFDFAGEPNHAGATRMEDRHDPMLTYAMTALAANKQARLAGQRATFGRIAVEPNVTNAVPSLRDRVARRPGLVATTPSPSLVAEVERQADDRAGRDGTVAGRHRRVGVRAGRLRPRPRPLGWPRLGDWPVIPTRAGHDAGILSAAGIPTAMLFVRNPTGISHSPDEFAETADCLAGVEALADVLAELAGRMTAYLVERAWLGDVASPTTCWSRSRTAASRRSTPDADPPRAIPVRGLDVPGLRQQPQPRLPPRAARPHPARAGHVLDLARPDVRRRRPARPRHLPRPRAGDVPRDGGRRDHRVGEFHYLHHQPDGTPYADAERDGARAGRTPRARPASGSRCSTRSTSRPGSAPRPRGCRCATATGRWSAGSSGSTALSVGAHARVGRGHPLGPRGPRRAT